MKNNMGSAILAHVRSCCPDLKDDQPEALCSRVRGIRTRLTCEGQPNYVPALNTPTNKLEFARMCKDSESQCAVAILQRVHCVGAETSVRTPTYAAPRSMRSRYCAAWTTSMDRMLK